MRKGKTINDAAHEWVNGFNAIPTGIIDKLMSFDREDWHELTIRSIGERVYCNKHDEYGEIELYDDETDDCADCPYAGDYHFVNGECVRREENE